ncbi:MAG: hypothetical protein GWM98_05805, partial [Nitrospinaceae bacterium]|nr:hypothetical protein [Nitrospinaceae bacterium]NIR54073.1 hypothetical protein [Nitrospinaceae bacterium]NIS84491.1 hypothetical protein [Nitrospinaceae bacterium]NIT81286.1 hypothetical protein [Nitrospinaceae bacterium]NIU43573.1 hypothetical protein [Nitrospinaceae bacterium]
LDENFFLYNEEDDFCRRARKTGHRVCYFPETAVQHLRGCSTHQPGIREKVIVETYRSNLYFFAKYYSQPWNWLLRTLYRLTFGLGILRTLGKRLRGRRLDGPDDSIALKFRLLRMPSGIRRAPPSAGFGPR